MATPERPNPLELPFPEQIATLLGRAGVLGAKAWLRDSESGLDLYGRHRTINCSELPHTNTPDALFHSSREVLCLDIADIELTSPPIHTGSSQSDDPLAAPPGYGVSWWAREGFLPDEGIGLDLFQIMIDRLFKEGPWELLRLMDLGDGSLILNLGEDWRSDEGSRNRPSLFYKWRDPTDKHSLSHWLAVPRLGTTAIRNFSY